MCVCGCRRSDRVTIRWPDHFGRHPPPVDAGQPGLPQRPDLWHRHQQHQQHHSSGNTHLLLNPVQLSFVLLLYLVITIYSSGHVCILVGSLLLVLNPVLRKGHCLLVMELLDKSVLMLQFILPERNSNIFRASYGGTLKRTTHFVISLFSIWLKSKIVIINFTLSLSSEVTCSLPDRPRPPPADLTTGGAPLSAPERRHWPRPPLWRPAHVHQWSLRVRQRGHPPPDRPGSAALHYHTCSGHDGWPLRAWCCRYEWWPDPREIIDYALWYKLNNRSVVCFNTAPPGSQDLSHVMGNSGLVGGGSGGQEITLTINNSSLTQALAQVQAQASASCSSTAAGTPQEITLTISGMKSLIEHMSTETM